MRALILVIMAMALLLGGCNFGNNKDLKDPNRDSTTKAQKSAGTDDTSTP